MTTEPDIVRTTYAVRLEQHSDCDLFYVYTITRDGCLHAFGRDLIQPVAEALHRDLSKLTPFTVAWLACDVGLQQRPPLNELAR